MACIFTSITVTKLRITAVTVYGQLASPRRSVSICVLAIEILIDVLHSVCCLTDIAKLSVSNSGSEFYDIGCWNWKRDKKPVADFAGMLLPVAVWERGIRFPRQSCHGSSVEPNNMSISLIHTYHEGGLG